MSLSAFLEWTAVLALHPFYLCEDLRTIVECLYDSTECTRCGVAVDTKKKLNVCFVREGCLCFRCYHRSRWPKE